MYDKFNTNPLYSTNLPPTNLNPPPGKPLDKTNAPTTGSGLNGPPGPTPPPVVQLAYEAILANLSQIAPAISDDDMLALIALVEGKLKDTETQSSENTVNIDSQIKQGALKEQEQQLAAAQKQIEAAAAANKDESVWDKVKQAFEVLAAVVMIVVGVATAEAGPAGALLIAAGAAALMAALNSTVQMATGAGIIGHYVEAFGGSAQQAAEADLGFGVAMTAISLICCGGTAFAGVSDLTLVAKIATIAADIVNGVSSVVSGVGTGIAAVDTYDSTEDTSDADRDNAKAKKLEAFSDQIEAVITAILQDLANMGKIYDSTLGSITDGLTERGKTLTQAHLTA